MKITIKEAAKILDMGASTLHNKIATGQFKLNVEKNKKFWLLDKTDVLNFKNNYGAFILRKHGARKTQPIEQNYNLGLTRQVEKRLQITLDGEVLVDLPILALVQVGAE